MGTEVYANGNAVACKGGDAKVVAAFPDVCNSPPPPPAGPIPIPYPCSSFSSDMKEGSKDVKMGGKEVMLKNQSYFATSPLGDEAATKSFGGSLVTHTITGKTYFAAWSMDVKCEGQNVPRHMDITTSNHSSDPGSTPPFPDLEKLNSANYNIGECPCCKSTECPSALTAEDTPLTFEEFYKIKTNPARAAQFAYWKDVKTQICTCVPPNEVFPKKPCNVFREADDTARTKRIDSKWGRYSSIFREKFNPPLKTAHDYLPGVLAAGGETMVNYNRLMKLQKGPENKAIRKLAANADKEARVNHRVPKAAGGCPGAPPDDGNLQPQQNLCDCCRQIDQIMTDEWQN